jgi:O-antigen/teichoic acid export membrane protein
MGIVDADFGRQVKIGVVGRALGLAVAFGGSLFLAPELGPEDYGSFYILMATVTVADNPLTGWVTGCRKRMTQVDWDRADAVGAVYLGQLLYITLFIVGVWLLRGLIAEQTGNPDSWLHLSVLFAGVVGFKNTTEILKGTERFGGVTWLQAGREVARVGLQLLLVVVLGTGVVGMVGGMTAASLLFVVPVMLYVGGRPALPSRAQLRDIWAYAKSSIPNGFVATSRSRVDLLILGVLSTQTATGQYEIANKLVLPAMFIAGVASSGIMSRVSNFHSRGEDWTRELNQSLAYAPLFAFPIFWGGLAVGRDLIRLFYGPAFADAAPLLVGLALWMIFQTQDALLSSTVAGLDRPDLNLVINTGALVLNTSLGVALLYTVGPIGVVVATVVSQAATYGVRWWWLDGVEPIQPPVVKQALSGAGMFVVVTLLPTDSGVATGAAVGIGAVVYFSLLLLVSGDFRALVTSTLPSP